MVIECPVCGKPFIDFPSAIKVGRKYCSLVCAYKCPKRRKKLSAAMIGKKPPDRGEYTLSEEHKRHIGESLKGKYTRENSSRWKGGLSVGDNGYILVLDRKRFKNKSGQGRRCRYIAEQIIGRELSTKEIIHHIDGNKQNDEPSNLYLFSCQNDHVAFHNLKDKPILTSNLKTIQ